ncbi:MAG TPA: transglycosylase SLT domain-containing protein, partial [Draconibacterium sp.]|nr:transglycosylase SLT domain-containing protein [Draconibacterium sp.]
MAKTKLRKYLTPVLVALNVVVLVIILVSAQSGSSEVTVNKEVKFESVELPKKVSFAGEPMPLDRFYVKEALDRELLSNAYFHSQTIRYIKLVPRYFPIIEPILKEHGIPDDFKYLAVAESGLDPRAISPAQAAGFWQLMKGTATDYGLEIDSEVDERYH